MEHRFLTAVMPTDHEKAESIWRIVTSPDVAETDHAGDRRPRLRQGRSNSVAAAGVRRATATARTSSCGGFGGGLIAIRRDSENRKLDRVRAARASRASDGCALVHHDPFVALAAIITKVFVDRHARAPQSASAETLYLDLLLRPRQSSLEHESMLRTCHTATKTSRNDISAAGNLVFDQLIRWPKTRGASNRTSTP